MGTIKKIKLIVTDFIRKYNNNNTMAFSQLKAINFNVLKNGVGVALKRNFGASSVALNGDPIQNLFLSKLNEYKEKASGLTEGELVDPTPEIEEARQFDMDNLTKRYGGENMDEFPRLCVFRSNNQCI